MSELKSFSLRRTVIIAAIYVLFLSFFIFKMFIYSNNVGGFPDELAHISYIASLEADHSIIPEFKGMTLLTQDAYASAKTGSLADIPGYKGAFYFGKATNYLGHPPLYYQIMRLAGGVSVKGNDVFIDISRLRAFSISLAALAMLLIFYIGYSRLGKRPVYHLLYAAICVSVPMLAYDCAGINNDTLAFAGMSIYLLGMLRFAEKKRNFPTYLLIGTGVFVAMLSKVTAGLIVVISIFIFLLFYLIKEKNLRFLLSWRFLATLPLYVAVAAYFLAVHHQIGSFQPSLGNLNPQQLYTSIFYIQPSHRSHMSFIAYSEYYIRCFSTSWTGILSFGLVKGGHFFSLGKIGLDLLWVLPLLILLPLRKKIRLTFAEMLLTAIFLSVIITVFTQFIHAYYDFTSVSGYLGGFQSRYYLCAIPAFALAITLGMKKVFGAGSGIAPTDGAEITTGATARHKTGTFKRLAFSKENVGQALCILFTLLLLYEDFIYFALHFSKYL